MKADVELPETPVLLRPDEAAGKLRISERRLSRLRVEGGGPDYIKLGHRTVRYDIGSLRTWLEKNSRHSTSDNGAGSATA